MVRISQWVIWGHTEKQARTCSEEIKQTQTCDHDQVETPAGSRVSSSEWTRIYRETSSKMLLPRTTIPGTPSHDPPSVRTQTCSPIVLSSKENSSIGNTSCGVLSKTLLSGFGFLIANGRRRLRVAQAFLQWSSRELCL